MCTAVIQRVHRSVYAPNRSWAGWGPFSRFLFTDGAIFVEAALGDIRTETADAWAHARRSLFGLDSIDEVKTELAGAWDTKSLVLGFEVDSDRGPYQPQRRKSKEH